MAGFDAASIGQGRGFAGRLYRLELRYDRAEAGAPATLIAKFASDHAPTREVMADIGGYRKEVRFYRELAAQVPLPTPRCYHASYDEEAKSFVLLLEDLAPAAAVDLATGLSVEAKEVLTLLARTHARFWNRTAGLEWLAPDLEYLNAFRRRYLAALPATVQRFGARFPVLVRVARQVGWILEGDEFMRRIEEPPQTLTHADLHIENLFFPTAAGGRFAVVDWQSVLLARHGAADVSRLIGMGLLPQLRRERGEALLRHYHETLLSEGVRGYGLRQLRRRYREELASPVLVAVVAIDALDFGDAGGFANMMELFGERLSLALEDERVPLLLGAMIALMWPLRPLYRAWLALQRVK